MENIVNDTHKNEKGELALIPKYIKYMEYMLEIILLRLPRTEKYSIGTEYKTIMYDTFRDIMYIEKLMKKDRLYFLNRIDANLNTQRALLRIMNKYKWIDEKRFDYVMNNLIKEIGQILGGLIKYYAKNYQKCIQ